MAGGNYIRGDGNGGIDANIQKAALKKWGPLGAALFLALAGLGSQVGQELWDALLSRKADLERVTRLEEAVETNYTEDHQFRSEYREDTRAIRAELGEIKSLIIRANQGDDQ